MSRSLKKGPYIDQKLMEKIKAADKGELIKTWARESTISPEMIGYEIGVYDGREHIRVKINEEMVGHKLGEFALTTKFEKHGGRKAAEEERETRQKAFEKSIF